jgi:CheY-like chemotaxis protein
MTLPTGDDENDEPDREGHASKGLRSLRVLLVEDEFFISLSTEAMIEHLGHVIVGTAVSADDAIALALAERPDVILMDIRLVGTRDGIDAATEIHNRLGIRSLFVTANTDQKTRQRALAAKPAGFIEKPLTEQRLRDALLALD